MVPNLVSGQELPAMRCESTTPAAIRVLDCRMAAILSGALPRSATLRALVARIEELRGIVYVDALTRVTAPGSSNELVGATGLRTFTAGEYRIVYVAIVKRYDDRGAALLAHEFRHVIELLEPGRSLQVRGYEILPRAIETQEAIDAQSATERELRASRR
jgi:hypothetical protein